MNTGDASEKIVRMGLEVGEITLKLTGQAAARIAVAFYKTLTSKEKIKGADTLKNMIKSGKELTVFTLPEKDLKAFKQNSKNYGILYSVVKNKNSKGDEIVDIIVRAEDAAKINRIVDRLSLANVEKTKVEPATMAEAEKAIPIKDVSDEVLDNVLENEGKAKENPSQARTEKENLSEPKSKSSEKAEFTERKPSVREELKKIKSELKESETKKPEKTKQTTHQQPAKKKKSKGKNKNGR